MRFERGNTVKKSLKLGTVGKVEASLREYGWNESECPDWAISCWQTDDYFGVLKKRVKYVYLVTEESVKENFTPFWSTTIQTQKEFTKYPDVWIYFAVSDGESEIMTVEEFTREPYEV